MLALLVFAAGAAAAQSGSLTQLKGTKGCVVDRAKPSNGCAKARALKGPGPFMGSRAIAVSPDGANVYVASSSSDAIAIFSRDRRTGALKQPKPGAVAASPSKARAAAARRSGSTNRTRSPSAPTATASTRPRAPATRSRASVRNPKTGALRQLPPALSGCIAGVPIPGCATGLALLAPDVVVVSPDGNNVYVGSFFGNSVAAFTPQPAAPGH